MRGFGVPARIGCWRLGMILVLLIGLENPGTSGPDGTEPTLDRVLRQIEELRVDPRRAQELVDQVQPATVEPTWAPDSPEVQHFETRIRPVLIEVCANCHSGDHPKSGFRVQSRESLIRGGERGPAVDLANPSGSRLLRALRYEDPNLQMPPKEKLSEETVREFAKWLESGAPWPADLPVSSSPMLVAKKHWAFQPVHKPVPPEDPSGWSENKIDRFLQARRAEKGLAPAPPAEKRVLIRRLYNDLIGLPPTPQEVEAFLSDSSPDAYDRLVDRLLDSPHYGERWGRYWMDVVRYADTAGDSADYPIPEVRRYRDYIIDSLNSDKPYNVFIKEQIAGDLLARQGPDERYAEQVIATGFIALSRRFGVLPYQTMHEVIEDTIDTTGRAFLGLTLKCARCHDHKFDPITKEDYYGLYGFFASTNYPFAGSETSISKGDRRQNFVPLVRGREVEKKIEAYEQRVEDLRAVIRYLEEEAPIKDEIQKYEKQVKSLEKSIALAEKEDGFDGEPLKGFLDIAKKNLEECRKLYRRKLQAKKEEYKKIGFPGLPDGIEGAYAVTDGPEPKDVPIQIKGNPSKKGKVVPRHVPAALRVSDSFEIPQGSSGRLQLAEWLASEKNPLTARVMVNRIWQHHFGRGIVRTASNFGVTGADPTHPELLDWLAATFVESGWSIKTMHRSILASKTYRMSSQYNPDQAEIDPKNEFLWRYPPRRMDAESLRDALLATSGLLDRGRAGPHPFPPMTKWRFTQHTPFQETYPSHHRSVYLMTPRFQRHPYLGLFDGPDTNRSTGVRAESTVPLQALYLMNNEFVQEMSSGFANRLLNERETEDERIERAYRLAFGRSPGEEEIRITREYLRKYREQLVAEQVTPEEIEPRVWTSLARVLFSSNEFFYLD